MNPGDNGVTARSRPTSSYNTAANSASATQSPHSGQPVDNMGSSVFSKFRKLRLPWGGSKDGTLRDNKPSTQKASKGARANPPPMIKPGPISRQESERRDRLERTPQERRSKRDSWGTKPLQTIHSQQSETNVDIQERRRSVVDYQALPPPHEEPTSPTSMRRARSPSLHSPNRQSQMTLSGHPHSIDIPETQELNHHLERQTTADSTVGRGSIDSRSNYGGATDTTRDSRMLGDYNGPYEGGANAEEEDQEWKWILNLSMHFRDASQREKFFVTYAQTNSKRRRITVSVDYRHAELHSLEDELSHMKSQKEKSHRIYESIKGALSGIQFYDTTTNLKLLTENGRLNVHVTEDIHEIIHYPSIKTIAHLDCPKIRESELEFDSHLSGFVYKVYHQGTVYIKKEIPSPDTVDEFLYEINALYALRESENVIRFGGCIVDENCEKVKGLLISFAAKGALIDLLYTDRGQTPWKTREKWARQVVAGLADIHEAGYVQGDFTLSNIVVDDHNDAKIIDINRRGCPVGWEPPEITRMIEGLQRIGIYIGVKSDIFQLGMCLWGIAMENDEPEYEERPLRLDTALDDVPEYFKVLVNLCLDDKPQNRPSAKELLLRFPTPAPYEVVPLSPTIIEVVAPYDDESLSNPPSPSLPQTKPEFIHLNGLNFEIPLPDLRGMPPTNASGSNAASGSALRGHLEEEEGNTISAEENYERFEAGIEGNISHEDEVLRAMDHVVEDLPVPQSSNGTLKRGAGADLTLDIPGGSSCGNSPKLNGNSTKSNTSTSTRTTPAPSPPQHSSATFSKPTHVESPAPLQAVSMSPSSQDINDANLKPNHTDSGFAEMCYVPDDSPVSPLTKKPLKMVPVLARQQVQHSSAANGRIVASGSGRKDPVGGA